MTTAAATEAFSEPTLPLIGIEAIISHFWLTSVDSPLPSPPITMAVGNLKSTCVYPVVPPMLTPITQTPRRFRPSTVCEMFATIATARYSTAPAEALATAGVIPTARLERTMTRERQRLQLSAEWLRNSAGLQFHPGLRRKRAHLVLRNGQQVIQAGISPALNAGNDALVRASLAGLVENTAVYIPYLDSLLGGTAQNSLYSTRSTYPCLTKIQ